MKIAFIMLCHKNPDQINLFIERLSEYEGADVYVHVDRNHNEVRDGIRIRENVKLIPEERSLRIQWGSVDIVKATLELIREVKESGIAYDYLWLVSGQDYPICPSEEVLRRLSAQPGINYIETIPQADRRYNWYKKLYEMSYPAWINKNSIPVKILKRLYIFVTGGHRYTFPMFIRKKPFAFDFSFGSQWWTLTSEAAFEILVYSDSHPEILKYYEKSIIPDESFFQTIFMRGPYSEQRAMNLTFINWGSNRRSPETLTEKDSEKLSHAMQEGFCFARKFELLESGELMNRLKIANVSK